MQKQWAEFVNRKLNVEALLSLLRRSSELHTVLVLLIPHMYISCVYNTHNSRHPSPLVAQKWLLFIITIYDRNGSDIWVLFWQARGFLSACRIARCQCAWKKVRDKNKGGGKFSTHKIKIKTKNNTAGKSDETEE